MDLGERVEESNEASDQRTLAVEEMVVHSQRVSAIKPTPQFVLGDASRSALSFSSSALIHIANAVSHCATLRAEGAASKAAVDCRPFVAPLFGEKSEKLGRCRRPLFPRLSSLASASVSFTVEFRNGERLAMTPRTVCPTRSAINEER